MQTITQLTRQRALSHGWFLRWAAGVVRRFVNTSASKAIRYSLARECDFHSHSSQSSGPSILAAVVAMAVEAADEVWMQSGGME